MRALLLFWTLCVGYFTFAQSHELKVDISVPQDLNYGGEISLSFYQVGKKGRVKPLNSAHKNGFTFDIENGYFTFDETSRDLKGKLTVAPYPENWYDSLIVVKIRYTHTPMFSSETYEKRESYQFEIGRAHV